MSKHNGSLIRFLRLCIICLLIVAITLIVVGIFGNTFQLQQLKSFIGDIGVVKQSIQVFIIAAGILIAIETIAETKRQNAKRDWLVLYNEEIASLKKDNRRMYQFFVSRSDVLFNEFYRRDFVVMSRKELERILKKYFKSELRSFEESSWLYESFEGVYGNKLDFYCYGNLRSVIRICVYHDLCYDGFYSDLSGILFEIFNEKMSDRTIDPARKTAIAYQRATEINDRRNNPDKIEV